MTAVDEGSAEGSPSAVRRLVATARPYSVVGCWALVVLGIGALLHRVWPDVWSLPGQDAGALEQADPSGWGTALVLDLGFALLVGLALLNAIWLGDRRRTGRDDRGEPWLRLAALVSVAGYVVADWREGLLLALALHGDGVSAWHARLLAGAMHITWGMLVVAVLVAVGRWHRPPLVATAPGPDTAFVVDPSRPPDHLASAWQPRAGRLGISLSGGGVRSASFAIGALQALRDLQVLPRARYVTAASGGAYAAMAFTAANQSPGAGTMAPPPMAPGSPEEQWVRRSLRYLVADVRKASGSIARIVFGILINLFLLYWVLFAAVRPVSWLIGTPLVQRGLRIEQPFAEARAGWDDDPDTAPSDQPYLACVDEEGAALPRPDRAGPLVVTEEEPVAADPARPAWTVAPARWPSQCVRYQEPDGNEHHATVPLRTKRPGRVVLVDGVPEIAEQPVVEVATGSDGEEPCADRARTPDEGAPRCRLTVAEVAGMVDVMQPELEVADAIGGRSGPDALDGVISLGRGVTVEPVSVVERRAGLDVDARHWLPPLLLALVWMVFLLVRVIRRPPPTVWHWGLSRRDAVVWATRISGGLAATAALVLLLLPWLADAAPAAYASSPGAGFDWAPIGIRSLVAWPILAVSAVVRFFAGKKEPSPPKPSERNARALSRKLGQMAQRLVVGVVLVLVVAVNAVNMLVVGAMNGPTGQVPWLSREVLGHGLDELIPPDIWVWGIMVLLLIVTWGIGESAAWSPAPIYKRGLYEAFAWQRAGPAGRPTAKRCEGFGPDDQWARLVPRPGRTDDGRVGFLDGEAGDGTELVICCAANVHGLADAPTGRQAVSFTASRSVIGGPEVGWMDTAAYVGRLGTRRRWDATLPGMTAISGAAVSPAAGKRELGPIGSVLAVLNVRLGAWLPHPAWVAGMASGTRWDHNPGWPWFVREVARRFRARSPYLYVTDGGHWENLGLVEALRRGCTTVIVVSAAGDGELSHATLGEAIEIARTDLGVDVELDDVWTVRPPLGGDPPTLPSGRQYVIEPGPQAEVGRVAPRGYAFGSITYRATHGRAVETVGEILLLEATMVDGLPVDVHAYAEGRAEFPNVSTADQLFTDRDFESYRVLGREAVAAARAAVPDATWTAWLAAQDRTEPAAG